MAVIVVLVGVGLGGGGRSGAYAKSWYFAAKQLLFFCVQDLFRIFIYQPAATVKGSSRGAATAGTAASTSNSNN